MFVTIRNGILSFWICFGRLFLYSLDNFSKSSRNLSLALLARTSHFLCNSSFLCCVL